MKKTKLPDETRADLESQATIGPADVEKCRQLVRSLSGPVKYLDGKTVKTTRAEKVKGMWEAEAE